MKLTTNQIETLRKLKHGALPVSYRSGRTVVARQSVRKLMALGLVRYTNAYCAGLTDAGLAALVAEGAKKGRSQLDLWRAIKELQKLADEPEPKKEAEQEVKRD